MNKKKLSVVMAGAMLATTVAPIMAATTSATEVQASDLGLLIRKVRETITSKKFSDVKRNGNLAGQYVYFVKIDGKENTDITNALNGTSGTTLQAALQSTIGKLKAGQTVEICSRGFVEENDKVYANTLKEKYDTSDMSQTLADEITNAITTTAKNTHILAARDAIVVDAGKSVTINLAAGSGVTGPIVIKPGDALLDFTKYIDATGNTQTIASGTPSQPSEFCGFPRLPENEYTYSQDLADETIESFKIVGQAPNTFKVSDLYNGVMLTTQGHDLLAKLKDKTTTAVDYTTVSGLTIGSATYNLPQSNDGTYGFNITVTDNAGNKTAYTVKGENKKDAQTLLSWLYNKNAKVDILAGENRYETAVAVAKEYANLTTPFVGGKGTIVMVNGNSLVDGLSASPLAAQQKAPMLLVEKDRIPKATADYIKTLAGNATIGDLSGITIDLVGGTSVISRDVEKELKSLGFTVNRFGGKDRESTSMKVAKAISTYDEANGNKANKASAFVVGAEGEADAMSIASVASSTTLTKDKAVTPIIVSNKNGLSDDTLESLNGKNVTVVGGEAVVSNSEFDKIKEAVGTTPAKVVTRIAGNNRQETNAQVINKYYAGTFGQVNGVAGDVLVAKDGQRNKMELVDALTVSNLAAQKNAPIVLATNKLDKAQINALELNAKGAAALYQVGHGVSLDVVKALATMLGLN